jgi:hypothetical protein
MMNEGGENSKKVHLMPSILGIGSLTKVLALVREDKKKRQYYPQSLKGDLEWVQMM